MITGLFETHLNVRNIDRSVTFYRDVLGLELAHRIDARRCAFFWIGEPNAAMLGLWEKPEDEVQRGHFAFRVPLAQVADAWGYLEGLGLEVRNFLSDERREPLVFAWMPAAAVYFRDPDGHSLEFIAPLPGDPQPEAGIVTMAEWAEMANVRY